MYCTECGTKLLEGAYFCGECGQIQLKKAVQDAKAKKEDAIAALIDVTKNKLYYTAFRFLKDDATAEDVLQESYIQAFQSLDSLQDESKFISWMTTIVINRCKNYLATKKNTEFIDFSSLDPEKENHSFEPDIQEDRLEFVPDKNFNYEQLKQGLDQVLDELPDNQRMAILLYYLNEFKVKEVADIMNVSQGTIKSLLNYGRKTIKNKIEELRKQNKSFYSVVPIPFLVWMLKEEFKAQSITPQFVQNVMKGIGTSGVVSSTGAAAKGMLSIGGKAISAKVIAGFTALVIGVGSIGGYTLSQTVFKGTGKSDEKASAQESKDDIAAYDSILDAYFRVIGTGYMPDDESNARIFELKDSIEEMIMRTSSSEDITVISQIPMEDRLEKCGYAFIDLNNDGQSELLIGNVGTNVVDGHFFQLFTLDEKHNPIIVKAETYNMFDKKMESESVRSLGTYNYYLGEDKKVYFAGWISRYEENVQVAGQYQFGFDGTKLVCEEAYESGIKNYKIDMNTKNVDEVSVEEAEKILKEKIEKTTPIDFISFSKIAETRNKKIQKEGLYLKYIDSTLKIPSIFKYQAEGKSPQSPQYDWIFKSDEENKDFLDYIGYLDVNCWSQEEFPDTNGELYLSERKSLSESKKEMEKYSDRPGTEEYFGSERKYIVLFHSAVDEKDYTPDFLIQFVDLDNNECEYSISMNVYHKDHNSYFTKEEYDIFHTIVVDMIKSCTFLEN